MFEVTWSDPDRELVGERRARKGLEKREKDEDGASCGSLDPPSTPAPVRSSFSSDEKTPSEKFSKFFGSIRLKKSTMLSTPKNPSPPKPDIPISGPKSSPAGRSASSSVYTNTSSILSDDKPPTFLTSVDEHDADLPFDTSATHSLHGSRGSGAIPIESSGLARLNSNGSVVRGGQEQADSPLRGATRTSATIPKDASAAAPLGSARELSHASLNSPTSPQERLGSPPQKPRPRPKPSHSGKKFAAITSPTEQWLFPMPPSGSLPPVPEPAEGEGTMPLLYSRPWPRDSTPKSSSGSKRPRPPPRRITMYHAQDPDAWKSPNEWERATLQETEIAERDSGRDTNEINQNEHRKLLVLADLREKIKSMASATPNEVLTRLRGNGSNLRNEEPYPGRDTEGKLWLLSALYNASGPQDEASCPEIWNPNLPGQEVLALLESRETASYLSALHSESLITHLSPTPLPPQFWPNIRPLPSLATPDSALPLAPSSFTAVYSLLLPTVTAGPGVPGLLRNISRCLVPGGILHFAMIDLLPVAGSLGPRTRAWLEEHVLPGVRGHRRCASPSRSFPDWLADARLRADGSTITTVKSRAVRVSTEFDGGEDDDNEDGYGSGGGRAGRVDTWERNSRGAWLELHSTVGRMLWKETWGPYADGSGWWWQDRACVDECRRMGTYWEYSMVEAVKER